MTADNIYDQLLDACSRRSKVGAIRITATYEPVGGFGSKVFPPTYPDAGYLLEKRYVDGVCHDVVALDSVPSQANRLEEALLDATEAGDIRLPYIEVSAELETGSFRVTSLDAPHRSPDAYFRDSVTADGTPFDKSELGLRMRSGDARNARAFFEHSPTDLLLGIWDSQRGGRGLRLPRAYTSEIIALDPVEGRRAAGRLDPYNMTHTGDIIYEKGDQSNWEFGEKKLADGSKGTSAKKLSNINHGNALASDSPGGVAITAITRTAVVSFGVLNRLRFPDGGRSADADVAGRAVLASIALVGDRLAFSGASAFLRSGCDLVSLGERLEWVRAGGESDTFELDDSEAIELFEVAVGRAGDAGLSFADDIVRLEPADNLRQLIELNLGRPAVDEE